MIRLKELRQRATLVLMAVTALVTLGVWASGNLGYASTAMGFIPARVGGLAISPALPVWLTPLSASLVHGSFLQLLFNLLLMFTCGRKLEGMLGAGPLIALYLMGAFAAATGLFAIGPGSVVPSMGASGAVSALVGAFAVSFSKPKRLVASLRLNRWLNIAWLMAAWIMFQLAVGYLGGQQGLITAIGAHVGGFLAGVLLQRPLLLWRYRRA